MLPLRTRFALRRESDPTEQTKDNEVACLSPPFFCPPPRPGGESRASAYGAASPRPVIQGDL